MKRHTRLELQRGISRRDLYDRHFGESRVGVPLVTQLVRDAARAADRGEENREGYSGAPHMKTLAEGGKLPPLTPARRGTTAGSTAPR